MVAVLSIWLERGSNSTIAVVGEEGIWLEVGESC